MNTHTTHSPTGHLSGARAMAAHGWQRVQTRIAHGWQAWQRARRLRRDEADFRRIDAVTLRDLGVSHSEHGSFWMEAEGLVPPTRERVLREQRQGGRR